VRERAREIVRESEREVRAREKRERETVRDSAVRESARETVRESEREVCELEREKKKVLLGLFGLLY
jgi:hypothetical protein